MPIAFREIGESVHNANLRPVVAAIDRHLSQLSKTSLPGGASGFPQLIDAWAELVRLLDLGPAPDMRACPVCGRGGLRAATRCGFCWTALSHAPARSSAADEGSADAG